MERMIHVLYLFREAILVSEVRDGETWATVGGIHAICDGKDGSQIGTKLMGVREIGYGVVEDESVGYSFVIPTAWVVEHTTKEDNYSYPEALTRILKEKNIVQPGIKRLVFLEVAR